MPRPLTDRPRGTLKPISRDRALAEWDNFEDRLRSAAIRLLLLQEVFPDLSLAIHQRPD